MQIQTQVTETIKQVQVIQEVKKQKATVTIEVDQDFVDILNVLGKLSQDRVQSITGIPDLFKATHALWRHIRRNSELTAVLGYEYPWFYLKD